MVDCLTVFFVRLLPATSPSTPASACCCSPPTSTILLFDLVDDVRLDRLLSGSDLRRSALISSIVVVVVVTVVVVSMLIAFLCLISTVSCSWETAEEATTKHSELAICAADGSGCCATGLSVVVAGGASRDSSKDFCRTRRFADDLFLFRQEI